MFQRKSSLPHFIAILFIATLMSAFSQKSFAVTAADLDREANDALRMLYKDHPLAESMSKKAYAIIVFPKITRVGLVFGGSYGEGVLLKRGTANEYINAVSGSFGWQAGAQSYSYVVFLMTEKIENSLRRAHGWEIGVGPSVVVINEGIAKNLSSSSLKEDAYAYIFDQSGLMVSISLEGTKISTIKR